jgi:hypothetical protein
MPLITVKPQKIRHPVLSAVPRDHKKGNATARTVVIGQANLPDYNAALEAIGVSSHAYLRSAVGALIQWHHEQEKQKIASLTGD